MMNLRHFFAFILFPLLALGVTSCVDTEFDEPPVGNLPPLTANATIAQVKALYTGAADVQITEDWVLEGVVAADDESGNFFEQIAVQDATGGIIVRMNTVGLYNTFPTGSQVFIKAKGLYVGNFNGLPQLNGSPGEPIEELLIGQHVVAGQRDKGITATPVSLTELANPSRFNELLATLIEISDVQFSDASSQAPYADAVNRFSVNHTVEDCDGNSILLRSSGFADFASDLTPAGKGKLTAVLSVFRTDQQLLIRDTRDVQFTGPRCNAGGQGGNAIPVADLRALFTGAATTGPANSKIKGIVISDRQAGNITTRNLVLQDGAAGITVRFAADHNFNLGDEIEVSVGGVELSDFNGLVQLNNVPNNNASVVATGRTVTPRDATVAELLANGQTWESTLVRITDATITGAATYNGNTNVGDGTATIPMFTRATAAFASSPVPTGLAKVTAILSDFNGLQINLRNISDVEANGGSGGDPVLINLADVRALFTGATTIVPAARKIRGVVISDRGPNNTTTRNLVLQDGTAGIVVRFTADHAFELGEEIEVNVSAQELSEFNGLLQVNNVPLSNAVSFGPGVLPSPRTATVAEVVANANAWESTLVEINDAVFTEGGTYSGSKNVTDGTGNIVMFTRSQASFANTNVPTGAVTITAVVSDFNAPQLFIRNLSDID